MSEDQIPSLQLPHSGGPGSGPLSGVRVIDLSGVLAGPYATQILADHGADVIKMESPGGGDSTRQIGPSHHPGMGPLFLNLNRGKRSVVLDLKQPAGLEAMRRLLVGADVFMHNLRPASIDGLSLGDEQVRAIRPDIFLVQDVRLWGGRTVRRPARIRRSDPRRADLQARAAQGPPRYVPLVIADKWRDSMPSTAFRWPCVRERKLDVVAESTCQCSRPSQAWC